MDVTPKLKRKTSLSLSTRLNQRKHSASPQNCLKTSFNNSRDLSNNCEILQQSPSVLSICSDGGIECTPPHKKMVVSLDESLDFSPKVLDSSFSPTCLLSQSLAIHSPEVGWKWNRHTVSSGSGNPLCEIESSSERTPDSAYAADSSFTSPGSSNNKVAANDRKRTYSYTKVANDARRKDQRKILELEMRRVEKSRADEKLMQRCAKLQEQMKSASTHKIKSIIKEEENFKTMSHSSLFNDNAIKTHSTTSTSISTEEELKPPEKLKSQELLHDFFNDSDFDRYLLEATQEVESKIDSKNQSGLKSSNTTLKSSSSECTSINHVDSVPATTSKPPSDKAVTITDSVSSSNMENKDKRSSFYMQFFEDDCSDDWFVSLDEAILQATQNKKPRTSLQRYKSMPTETVTNSHVINEKDKSKIRSKTNSSKELMFL